MAETIGFEYWKPKYGAQDEVKSINEVEMYTNTNISKLLAHFQPLLDHARANQEAISCLYILKEDKLTEDSEILCVIW